MPWKSCIHCGKHFQGPGSRCPEHPYRRGSRASRSGQPERSNHERLRRKAAVDRWVAEHGRLCPGYAVPAHASFDLTADHRIPVSLGGDPGGELEVLCRSCNSRKGGRNRLRSPNKRTKR